LQAFAEKGMSRRIYFVRHGETEANRQQPALLQGCRLDWPLSPRGRWQAERVRDVLAHVPVRAVISSPLRRAVETATIVAQPHGLQVACVAALRECDVGRWEGKSWEEIRQQDPEQYALFHQRPDLYGYPEGETFQQVAERIFPALEEIFTSYPSGDLVVVWHHTVGRIYLACLLGIGASKARVLTLDNGSISVVEEHRGSLRPRTINFCLHLSPFPWAEAVAPTNHSKDEPATG
jgi:broad specificity phosphatase PhoE